MSNKMFLMIHSGIYALFAFVLFFLPEVLWPYYGVEIRDQYAYFLSQHNSIFLGGIAVMGMMLSGVEERSAMARQLFKGLMWTNLLGLIITLYAGIKGIFVGFGWSDPAFFALLALLNFWKVKANS